MKRTLFILTMLFAGIMAFGDEGQPSQVVFKPATAQKQVQPAQKPLDNWTFIQPCFWFGLPTSSQNSNVYGLKTGQPISSGTGRVYGIEVSWFVAATDNINGLQVCWIYTQSKYLQGIEASLICNYNKEQLDGLQAGLVNIAGNLTGFQPGFICVTKDLNGIQGGFIDVAQGKTIGAQFSLVGY